MFWKDVMFIASKINRKVPIGLIAGLSLFFSTYTWGEELVAGSLSRSSSATVNLSLQLGDQVMVSGLDDIYMGVFDNTRDLSGSDSFCVYRTGGENYLIAVYPTNDRKFEAVSATTGDKIPYQVRVDDDLDASDAKALKFPRQKRLEQTGSADIDCKNGNNATIQVDFKARDLRKVQAANDYLGTVLVLVTPI